MSSRQTGFTLIELLVVVIISGLLLAAAVPAFSGILNSNRLAGLGNDIAALLQSARMEAVRTGRRVLVCPTSNGTSCTSGSQWDGLLSFRDDDANGAPAAAEIRQAEWVRAPMQLWVSDSITDTGDLIVFRPDGFAYDDDGDLLAANLSACLPVDRPLENVRDVTVSAGGRIGVSARNAAAACAVPSDP